MRGIVFYINLNFISILILFGGSSRFRIILGRSTFDMKNELRYQPKSGLRQS